MIRAFDDAAARHRMLEGFLARLALAPDADAFVLRGGMLVRHWFPEVERPARDVDLVCRLPYDQRDLRERLVNILGEPRVRDGVLFDTSRVRIDALWPDSEHPGLRLFAAGRADGRAGDITVDLTFHLEVWPSASPCELPLGAGRVPLWVCPPEMLIGRKLKVTADLSVGRWRPKDLADVWLMLGREPDRGRVGESIERLMPRGEVSALLDRGFWLEPGAASRWGRFHRDAGRTMPADLAMVVEEVRARLSRMVGSA